MIEGIALLLSAVAVWLSLSAELRTRRFQRRLKHLLKLHTVRWGKPGGSPAGTGLVRRQS